MSVYHLFFLSVFDHDHFHNIRLVRYRIPFCFFLCSVQFELCRFVAIIYVQVIPLIVCMLHLHSPLFQRVELN